MDLINRFKRDIVFATDLLEEVINQDYENQNERNCAITTAYCTLKTVISSFDSKKPETNIKHRSSDAPILLSKTSKDEKYNQILDKINEALEEMDENDEGHPDFEKNDIQEISMDKETSEIIICFNDGQNIKYPITKFFGKELREMSAFIMDKCNTYREVPDNCKESNKILDLDTGKTQKIQSNGENPCSNQKKRRQ